MTTTSARVARVERGLLLGFFVSAVGFAIWALSGGWNNPILDHHAFRQTQTAISTYYMVEGGPLIAYETPVLGAPWAIPFEFPLYQWLVAGLTVVGPLALEQSGRAVSVAAFLATLVPIWFLLDFLDVPRRFRLVFLSLYLVSPVGLFFSRTFMIESTVLLLSLLYLLSVAGFLETRRSVHLFLGFLFGALAALVKITTFLPFWLAAGLLAVLSWRRRRPRPKFGSWLKGEVLPLVTFVVLPILSALPWFWFADILKERNYLGSALTSRELIGWNFGTLEQRLSMDTWRTLYGRLPLIIGGFGVWLAAGVSTLLARKSRAVFIALSAIPLAAVLVFTNLHVVHDYYQYSVVVFLVAAVGFGVTALLQREDGLRWLAFGVLGVAMFAAGLAYVSEYRPRQITANDRYQDLAMVLADSTESDEVIVVFGADWTFEIAYLAERRALMISSANASADVLVAATKGLEEYRVGMMVVCGPVESQSLVVEWADQLATEANPILEVDGCLLYP